MFHLPSVSVLDGKREARWECQPNAKKACYGNCPSMSVAVGRVSWGESWVTLWRYIILILDFVKGKRNRWRVYVVITTFFLWGANCRLQTRIMKTNSTFHQCPFWAPWLFFGVAADSFWFVSLSSKNNNMDLRPRTRTRTKSAPSIALRARSDRTWMVLFFSSSTLLGFMGCFCGSEARLIPVCFCCFGVLVFGFPFLSLASSSPL